MTPDQTADQRPASLPQDGTSDGGAVAPQEAERRRRLALGEQAWAAFQRDWPQLAQEHYGQWVAYQGDERIGLGTTGTELYRRCLQRGLQRGEFYVGRIEERETPPWGAAPLDRSLYEASDVPPPGAAPPPA